jgi:hypothetical protein
VTGHREEVEHLRNKRRDITRTNLVKRTPGPAHTLSGNHSGQAALRREQREQLESNLRENRAMGKEGKRSIKDITSIALGKEETAVGL